MSTALDERTDVRTDEETDDTGQFGDGYKHYFTKADLDRNLFDGAEIRAACGWIKRGLANPVADLPTCAKCLWHYENTMRPGDDE